MATGAKEKLNVFSLLNVYRTSMFGVAGRGELSSVLELCAAQLSLQLVPGDVCQVDLAPPLQARRHCRAVTW